MTRTLTILALLISFSSLAQVKDDPDAKKQSKTIGFASFLLGGGYSGEAFTEISYSHRIGSRANADLFVGGELGISLVGNENLFAQYSNYLGTFIITNRSFEDRRFSGYASAKMGVSRLKSVEDLYTNTTTTDHSFDKVVFRYSIGGGLRLRLAKWLYLDAELGLGNMVGLGFGMTFKF